MEKLYNEVRDYYYNLTNAQYYKYYVGFREKRVSFLEELSSKVNRFVKSISPEADSVELFSAVRNFVTILRESINSELSAANDQASHLLNQITIKNSDQLFQELPEKLLFEQTDFHFTPSSTDSIVLKSGKLVKKGILPVYRIINKKRRYWNREVPFADIVYYYFEFKLKAEYNNDLYRLIKQDFFYFNEILEKLRLTEREVSEKLSAPESILSVIGDFGTLVEECIEKIPTLETQEVFCSKFINLAELFRYSIDNAGTIAELPGKFNREKSDLKITSLLKLKDSRISGFGGFFSVMREKLDLVADVFSSCLDMGANIIRDVEKHTKEIKESEIAGLSDIAAEIKEKTGAYSNDKDLKTFLENLKEDYKHILTDEEAITLIEKIPYSGIKLFAEKYASYLRKGIDNLKENYRLVNLDDVHFTISPAKFAEFDPKDIITTLYFKDSTNQADKYSEAIKEDYQHSVKNLIDCPDIVEFNIDTAIDVLVNSPTKQAEAKKIAFEGINRVIAKLEEAADILTKTNERYAVEFKVEAFKFITEYRSVLNVSKVTAVILQLSKERTKEHLKQSLRDIWEKIKRFIPILVRRGKQIVTGTKHIYGEISRKVGLTESAGEISAEISDYLLEVESNVSKLPKVYQRLFRYEPLSDERFLVGRHIELEQIKSAYNRWKHGHHASLALIGEKGAGISTLLNFAENKFLPKKKLFRIELKETIFDEGELIRFLSEFLSLEGINDEHDLIYNLKIRLKGSTVVLENGEDLFLRTPSGFEAISSLLRFITLTSDEIFWVITFNKYSWAYLAYTINIGDYFTNYVELGRGNETQIENIIMARHSVSGYKIIFEPGKQPKQGFNKLGYDEKQRELKKIYFETLNELCEGNVALALVFWLRSVSRFDQEVIHISDLNDLDFEFVKKLSDNKHFNLAAVLLHDGITLPEYQLVFNTNYKEAQLQLLSLLDDGILFERKGRYKINFLLYRQVVNSLKTKNLLQ